jgi:hypothetical protein
MNTGLDLTNGLLLFVIAIGVYILLRDRLSSRSRFQSREEWVKSYLKQHPQALPLQIIGPYNSQRRLGKRWGYFSLREMERLVAKIKSESGD